MTHAVTTGRQGWFTTLRHVVGGNVDCSSYFRINRTRKRPWDYVTGFNGHHRLWAWVSLFGVALTDLYIRLVASGTFTEPTTWSSCSFARGRVDRGAR
jgi:hypothetical protein